MPTATTTTIAGQVEAILGHAMPAILMRSLGSSGGADTEVVPKFSTAIAVEAEHHADGCAHLRERRARNSGR